MEKREQRYYLVEKAFETSAMLFYAAPFSLSEDVTVPAGVVLREYVRNEHNDAPKVSVAPLLADDWLPFLISPATRSDKRFRGYEFWLQRSLLDTHCRELPGPPPDAPVKLRLRQAVQGCLFGTAVADAIGLPFEGMSPRRIGKMKPLPLRQRFFFGTGLVSDDTEHTCMVAQSLIAAREDPDAFARALAWRMRWWFLGLPAGIGLATLRACLKLWLGVPTPWSGIFSAGNGPAMRSAIIGVYARADTELLRRLVAVNTTITHRDPRALRGATIVAELARHNSVDTPLTVDNCMTVLQDAIGQDGDLRERVAAAVESAAQGEPAPDFCRRTGLGKGVSGYMYHTVPVVIQIVLRHPRDFDKAVTEAILCGGDTDTVAAIVGGIVGAGAGVAGIPGEWIDNLCDWPRSNAWIRFLGDELVRSTLTPGAVPMPRAGLLRIWTRNAFFMAWVLAHGFRRLLPPY